MVPSATEGLRRPIAIWLLCSAAMVVLMVLVGGWTRLTNSGLSIVEWKPISGVIPPLSESAWLAEFDRYKQFPEFHKVHSHFELGDFKRIYFWEYSHRLLGRLTGLVFGLPLLFFTLKRALDRALTVRLVGLLFLGGLQGFIGWWMVKSGLSERADVSAVRLATHLGMAFLLFAALLWTALDLLRVGARAGGPGAGTRIGAGLWVFVFLTVLSGALVAGLNGGHTYNTFPLMGGELVPPGLLAMQPWWLNPFENPVSAQWNHRVMAISLTVTALVARATLGRASPEARRAANVMVAVVLLQATLGVATLLSVVWAPLASSHQIGALTLLGVVTWLNHTLRRPRA